MYQLEDAFNRKYMYDWIFFSTEQLSEKFRRYTSNATLATCIYEVIRNSDVGTHCWRTTRQGPDGAPTQASQESPSPSPTRAEYLDPLQSLRQIQRWNNGPFAREKRLQSYDWFWRIEPGVQFTFDITFDVFRFMRDHNITYGSNRATVAPFHTSSLSQQVQRFMDKHPDLLHADADVSWLLGSSGSSNARQALQSDYAEDLWSSPLRSYHGKVSKD
ncbi:uncharacterized protein UV8b_05278 [Ustilaginoidea virens]|nr:uncharacterized protein UV8b_05278 [Ustilaginoidea virens]QUC21037.1 hypothetical protein UV8b_05278 [Ustilaginoidea virens]